MNIFNKLREESKEKNKEGNYEEAKELMKETEEDRRQIEKLMGSIAESKNLQKKNLKRKKNHQKE